MKTKLLLLFAICTIGCTSDETKEVDCNCGTVISKMHFTFPDFTVLKVQNDCTGVVETLNLEGNQGELNGKWCK